MRHTHAKPNPLGLASAHTQEVRHTYAESAPLGLSLSIYTQREGSILAKIVVLAAQTCGQALAGSTIGSTIAIPRTCASCMVSVRCTVMCIATTGLLLEIWLSPPSLIVVLLL